MARPSGTSENASSWGKLDHAAKLFPAVSSELNTSTFRVSATLKHRIDPDRLQRALDATMKRYRVFAVRLGEGLFWNYFSGNTKQLMVEQEQNYPCATINPKDSDGYLLRVLYFGSKISVEFFHALTDGTGATEFLKTLLATYLGSGEEALAGAGIISPTSLPLHGEQADGFNEYHQHLKNTKSTGVTVDSSPARHLTGTPFEPYGHNVVQAQIPVEALKKAATAHGTTITGLLTAMILKALTLADPLPSSKPFVVCLPVNLRKVLPSKTLRNFFAVVNVGYHCDPSAPLPELIRQVDEEVRHKTSEPYLVQTLLDSMRFEKNITSRLTPSLLKRFAIRYGFNRFGETIKTVTLSNLGSLELPEEMRREIVGTDFLLYPTVKSPINISVSSYQGVLTLGFVRSIIEVDVVRQVLDLVRAETGENLTVTSNEWGVL